MKGVSKVDMDFKKGLFTMTVKEGTTVTPSTIRKAVRTRFEIPRIDVVGMTGMVKRTASGKTSFTATGQKTPYGLKDAKDKKEVGKLQDGQKVAVSGTLTEKKVDKKTHLVIAVSGVKLKMKTNKT